MSHQIPPAGWFTFGTHVDSDFEVDFSEQLDEEGEPRWERPHASVYSWTRYQAMCSEQCGWEGTDDMVDGARAEAESIEHNFTAHGIPRPVPKGGWHWRCECGWMVTSFATEEAMERGKAEHIAVTHPEGLAPKKSDYVLVPSPEFDALLAATEQTDHGGWEDH